MPRLFNTLKRLPRAWLVLTITVIAGLSEGFGLALFAPLIIILTGEGGELPSPFSDILNLAASIGIPINAHGLLATIVFFMIGGFGLLYAQQLLITLSKNSFVQSLRSEIIDSLIHSHWYYLSRQANGEVINQLLLEAERSGKSLMSLARFAGTVILLLIYLVISSVVSLQLVIITAILGLGLFAVSRPLAHRARRIGKSISTANRDFTFHAVDYLKGSKLIKVTGAESSVTKRIADFNSRLVQLQIDKEPVIETIHAQGQKVIDGVTDLISRHGAGDIVSISGHPAWTFLNFKDSGPYSLWQIKTLYMQEILAHGVLTYGTHNMSYAHTDGDVAQLLDVYDQVFPILLDAVKNETLEEQLHCPSLESLFKVR